MDAIIAHDIAANGGVVVTSRTVVWTPIDEVTLQSLVADDTSMKVRSKRPLACPSRRREDDEGGARGVLRWLSVPHLAGRSRVAPSTGKIAKRPPTAGAVAGVPMDH
jgi:hypothetical protein